MKNKRTSYLLLSFQIGTPCSNREVSWKFIVFIFSIISIAGGMLIYGKTQYHKAIKRLIEMKPHNVTLFNIYPKVIQPVGIPIEISLTDPIVNEFLQAITDQQGYSPTGGIKTVSDNYVWFLAIADRTDTFQIKFRIPSEKDQVVIGELGKYNDGETAFYGYFQSQQLFHWYQKYKDRWLTPAESPGATATPTPA